jgi:hypothetical protein
MPQFVTPFRLLLQNKERGQGYDSELEETPPTKVKVKSANYRPHRPWRPSEMKYPQKPQVLARSITRSVHCGTVGNGLIAVGEGEHYRPPKVPANTWFTGGVVDTVDNLVDICIASKALIRRSKDQIQARSEDNYRHRCSHPSKPP